MIIIDLPADLHFEDDAGNGLARLDRAPDPDSVRSGDVLVAGSADGFTWAEVLEVEEGWVHFRHLTTAEAAAKASLVAVPAH